MNNRGRKEVGPKRVRRPKWSFEETKVLADYKKAALLNGEEGGQVWEQIAANLSRIQGEKRQMRSNVECRRRWDTLKKVYNHIEWYCVQTGQQHWQLDEEELKSMNLKTAYGQDWYTVVKEVCGHPQVPKSLKRRRASNSSPVPKCTPEDGVQLPNIAEIPTPGPLAPLLSSGDRVLETLNADHPNAIMHSNTPIGSQVEVREVRCKRKRGRRGHTQVSKPLKRRKATNSSPVPECTTGNEDQLPNIAAFAVPEPLAPLRSSSTLVPETLTADHGTATMESQLPTGSWVEVQKSDLVGDVEILNGGQGVLQLEVVLPQQDEQNPLGDPQVRETPNVDHPKTTMDREHEAPMLEVVPEQQHQQNSMGDPQVQMYCIVVAANHGVATHSEGSSYMRCLCALPPLLETQSLDFAVQIAASGASKPQDRPYAVRDLSHIVNSGFVSNPEVKESNPELVAAWRIVQCMWKYDNSGVYEALKGYEWNGLVQPVAHAIGDDYSIGMLRLITVSVADASGFLGLSENETVTFLTQQHGCVVGPASQMLTVRPMSSLVSKKTDSSQLQNLTEYVLHLEH